MCRRRRYSVLATSTLLADSDRPAPASSATSGTSTLRLESAFDRPDPADFSLGEDFLQSFLQSMESCSPSAYLTSHMAWATLRGCEGSWADLRTAWLSILARRGHILRNKVLGVCGIVLHATVYGILILEAKVGGAKPNFCAKVAYSGVQERVRHAWISSVDGWQCMPTEAIAPESSALLGPLRGTASSSGPRTGALPNAC